MTLFRKATSATRANDVFDYHTVCGDVYSLCLDEGFCKCVRAMIVIQDGGELPCKQDRIQFLILCEFFLRRNDIRFILYARNFCRRYCFTALTSMIPFPFILSSLFSLIPDHDLTAI